MFIKEIILIISSVTYLLIISKKNWGKKFKCLGLSNIYYKKFIKNNSKEEMCRIIFENLFKVPFHKIRPIFLTNPKTNKKLELDGFNDSITTPLGKGLAFEYNGSQHYFFNPKYHKTYEDFENQQLRDQLKINLCKQNKIILIIIPYDIKEENLEEFIIKKTYEKELNYYFS